MEIVPPADQDRLARYGVGLLTTAISMLAAVALDRWSDAAPPFPLFLAAVMISSWYGGLGPGLLAIAIGLPVVTYLFLSPSFSPAEATVTGIEQLAISLLTALLISWLTARRQQAEARLAALLDQLPVGVGLMDAQGQLVLLNSVMRGYATQTDARTDLPETPQVGSHGGGGGTSSIAMWPGEIALAGKTIEGAEMLFRSEAGDESWIRISSAPFRDASDQIIGGIVIVQDIDFWKRAQEAVAESEARYRGLFESSADAILVSDGEGNILDANRAATTLIGPPNGHSRRLTLVPPPANMVNPLELPETPAVLPREGRAELVVRNADGDLVPVEASSTTVALPSQDVTLSTLRDISQRKRLENAQREFISSISHDLRTPLTAILTGVVLLQQNAAHRLEPAERELLAHAQVNSERLGRLIDDLLALSQLEAGIQSLEMEPLDLRVCVMSAVAAVFVQIQEKGQTLELDLPSPLPVIGDQARLDRVICNLLANAHQHTQPGSRIEVVGWNTAHETQLSVRDNGPGIPEEELSAIFERFHRLQDSGSGSGLGLAIARRLAEAHDGRLWAEPQLEGGSVFHLILPRDEREAAS